MIEPENDASPQPAAPADSEEQAPPDPKEAMRQALERKKAAQQGGTAGVPMDRERGQAHGQMGGRREFRRKSGG